MRQHRHVTAGHDLGFDPETVRDHAPHEWLREEPVVAEQDEPRRNLRKRFGRPRFQRRGLRLRAFDLLRDHGGVDTVVVQRDGVIDFVPTRGGRFPLRGNTSGGAPPITGAFARPGNHRRDVDQLRSTGPRAGQRSGEPAERMRHDHRRFAVIEWLCRDHVGVRVEVGRIIGAW